MNRSKRHLISPIMLISLAIVLIFAASIPAFTGGEGITIVMRVGSSQAIVDGDYTVVNEKNPAVAPIIDNDIAYVPVEFINDNFNAAIDITTVKAMSIEDIIFVPLRRLAEELGYTVYFKDGIIIVSNDKDFTVPDDDALAAYAESLNGLPVVGTKEKLNDLMGEFTLSDDSYGGFVDFEVVASEAQDSGASFAPAAESAVSAPAGEAKRESVTLALESAQDDYSATNTQVQGVDEGDIIKTDGKYIYFSPGNGDYVSIIKATPPGEMEEAGRVETGDFIIDEMYLNDSQLILITRGSKNTSAIMPATSQSSKMVADIAYPYPYFGGSQVAKVFVYDISDIKNIKQVKTFEIDGNINNSRKVGNALYIITNTYLRQVDKEFELPVYRDSAASAESALNLESIFYLPEAISQSITTITGIRLDKPGEEASMFSYLGNSETIYMSAENLFITTSSYNYSSNRPYASTIRTNIYKFGLDQGKASFSARGQVDGNILNQFSMDEYDGYFRIATTTWANQGGRSNNMFVLDGGLNKVGQLTNIAPNENIYSVRFLGDKAHMVTFEVVDPLFVIDLSKPESPTILGELKIPGYSVYLHPYDENHLIGFGYDTVEIDGSANLRGLKLSMFDISDLSNPKEKFTTIIGDRGTHSELLSNHKALLFSKEKNLLAFPIEVRALSQAEKNDRWAYGKFAFQGAYVYTVDMDEGFVLSGSISNDDTKTEGNYNEYVQRIIYIGDALYTASNKSIVATDMHSFERLGKASIN